MKGLTEITLLEEKLENRYSVQGSLGVGSYGKAVLATRKADGENVVIKQINVSDVDDQTRESALREAQMLSAFNHPNVIKYYECMLDEGCLNIVMEYASEGELSEAVAKRAAEKKPVSEDEIMMWFVQIVLALYHVHSKNILHRDLKSQNIFISEGNILKLGDFGISRVLNSDTELARTVIGTPYYLSPEICEDKPYNRKSDVWALGCVLYELCTLKRAFDGQSLPALVVKILKGKYPPVPTRYCSSMRNLVDSMLQQNPRDRPSIDGILRLSYVRGHVELYAQHVMALSPVTPENLGLMPADSTPEPRARVAAGTPVRVSASHAPLPGATPIKGRTPAAAGAAMPAPMQRSSSGEGAAAPSTESVQARGGPARSPAPLSPAPASQQHHSHSRPGSASSSNPDQGLKGVAPPPCADAGAAGFAGKKVIASPKVGAGTWMRNQQAQLAELEGALALQGHGAGAAGRRAAAPGPAVSAASTPAVAASTPAVAAASTPGSSEDQAKEAGEADAEGAEAMGRQGAGAARVGANAEACSSMAQAGSSLARAQVLQLKQAQRDAELQAAQAAVLQERARKRAAAAKRDAEKSVAVKNRVVERQRETERHLAEQRAREEEKAARARERAEQLKGKEESKAKLREDLAAHMAAHAAQVKSAKPRVNREELSKLGADFASRLHHVPSVPGAAAQVLVVDALDEPPARSANSATQAQAQSSSSAAGARPTAVIASPARLSAAHATARVGKPIARQSAPSPSPSKPKPAAGAHAQQPTTPQEPPWRAARAAGKPAGASAGFPDVQIFTPFGSELSPPQATPSKPDQNTASPAPAAAPAHTAATPPRIIAPQSAGRAGSGTPAHGRPHMAPAQAARSVAKSDQVAKTDQDRVLSIWARKGKEELLEVLTQIQEVLAEEGEEDEEEGSDEGSSTPAAAAAGTAAGAGMGAAASAQVHAPKPSVGPRVVGGRAGVRGGVVHGGVHLPPERETDELAGPSGAARSGAGSDSDAASNAHKVEQLRLTLESELGADAFLVAYRYVRQVAQHAEEGGDDDEGAAAAQHVALVRMLGRKAHLAHRIHTLITLEDKVFN